MKRFALPTLIALAGTSSVSANAQQLLWEAIPPLPAINTETTLEAKEPLQWELVPPPPTFPTNTYHSTTPQDDKLAWQLVTPKSNSDTYFATSQDVDFSSQKPIRTLVWERVDVNEVIIVEKEDSYRQEKSTESAIANAYQAIEQTSATFANDKALWRNDRWIPQISNSVPVGYGPTGIMTSLALNAIDCTASGICRGTRNWDDYLDQVASFGEAQYEGTLGFGDSQNLAGLIVKASFEETNIPLGSRNTGSQRTTRGLFDNYYIGLHLSRNIGIDTAVRIGVDNWLDVKTCGLSCGFPKSAYGVISQRIRLKDDQTSWFPNAYITAGAGNGSFRSLSERFRSSVNAQKDAGCSTFGYLSDQPCSRDTRRKAVLSAANYGQLAPIGSAALEIVSGVNLIGEWSQGNLNAGVSVRPFTDLGLVITTMWNTLLPNCDYGCDVNINGVKASIPDNLTTQRSKWGVKASLDIKF